ncbi:hypothetical protein AUJ63_04155 [Candidatus Pacearchaeota archaeon CG1_02_35_32]|nr:MAG: hypothetical protein AUJ63_04155 [Candidatus Pacearchaeota archaeon CG1_02_35_32]
MRLGIDILGNVAILKFDRDKKVGEKKKIAKDFLKRHKSVRTILEKEGKFSGRLRTQKTGWLAGEKTKEALYKENGCLFRFNVDTCYFSPRLSTERDKMAKMVKKNESVLVMFGGVAPFAIIIAKHTKAGKITSVELGRECSKYAKMNVKRNKVNVEIIQGDVRKKVKGKYDRIVMARPNLKDSFLDVAFKVCKGMIHYYGFYREIDKQEMIDIINQESRKAGKKIRILRVVKAGEIGSRKYRYRADIRVN